MKIEWSGSTPYGLAEIAPDAAHWIEKARSTKTNVVQCCIKGCSELIYLRRRGTPDAVCPQHQISLSSKPTYVYAPRQAKHNLIVGHSFIDALNKTESRFENENSEDAVSWNLFVSLLELGGLRNVFEAFTGIASDEEPELYVWGNRIVKGEAPYFWQNLKNVQIELESAKQKLNSRKSFFTEPDVILRLPGKGIVLIEAKFGSPNSIINPKKSPNKALEYLKKYPPMPRAPDPINRRMVEDHQHEIIYGQLLRNTIFAQWLAGAEEQPFLINLVCEGKEIDIQDRFQPCLNDGIVKFNRATWESLSKLPIIHSDEAKPLLAYLKNKTVNLVKAFKI